MGSRCNLVFHRISGRFLQPLTAIKFEISVSSPSVTKFCKKHPMRINVKGNCAGSLRIRHSRALHGILKHITMKRTFGAPSFGIPYGMVAARTAAGMACFLFLLLAFDHVALAVDTAPFSEETSNSITERKTVESILARQLALRFREMSDEELIQVLEDLLNASKPSITSQSTIPEGPFKQRIMEPTPEVKSNDNIFMDVLPSGTTSSDQKSDAEIGTEGNDAQEKHKIDDVSIIGEVSLSGASTILTAPVTNWWNYYQEFWIFLLEQTKSIYQQTFPYAEVILVGICLIIGGITLAKILKSDVWKSWFMREPGEKYFFRNKMYLLSAQLFRSLLSSVTSFVRLSQQQNPSKSIKNVDTKKTSSKRIDGVKDKDLSKATTKAGKAILADNDKDLSNPIGASLDDDGDLPSIKTYFRKRAKFKDEKTQPSSYVKTIDPSQSYRTQATFQFREKYENLRNRQQELARESSGNGLAYDINYANGPAPEFHSKVPPKIENKQMQTNEKEDNDNIPETNDIGKGDSFLHRGFLWAKDADGVYVRTNGNE